MSDKVYVLSITYHSADGDGSMYINEMILGTTNESAISQVSSDLSKARIFRTEQEAWDWREAEVTGTSWQITPIDAKKVFKKRLSG